MSQAAPGQSLSPPLVMRCGALGDMVLLTVLLEQLHARFKRPVDLICSAPWVSELLGGQPFLGEVQLLKSRRTPYWLSSSQQRLVRWLQVRGAGPTWYCDSGPGRALLTRGGIPDGHVCDSSVFPWVPGETFADRWLRLGSLSPQGLPGLPPAVAGIEPAARLAVSPAGRAAAEAALTQRGLVGRPYLVVHPGSSHLARRRLRARAGADRYWPEERWAEVLRGLATQAPGQALLLTGVRAERRRNDDILSHAQLGAAYNVAGELTLPALVALLAQARGMISVDTGPAHVAAALGTPTVALMPLPNLLYRPGGSTTPAATLCGSLDGGRSLLAITPAAVLEAWRGLQAPGLQEVQIGS